MKVTTRARFLHIAPRKIRLTADLIRGMTCEEAQNQLKFQKKRAARTLLKILNSACANAEHNFDMVKENLYISDIFVDAGPMLKRWRPRAFGRAFPRTKKTSHVTLILNEKIPGKKKEKKEMEKRAKVTEMKKQEEKKVKKRILPPKAEAEKEAKIKPKKERGLLKRFFRRKSV